MWLPVGKEHQHEDPSRHPHDQPHRPRRLPRADCRRLGQGLVASDAVERSTAMKTRLTTLVITMVTLSAILAPVAEAGYRWP